MIKIVNILYQLLLFNILVITSSKAALVITTWAFQQPTYKAWELIINFNANAVDALIAGTNLYEYEVFGQSIYSGSSDENGEITFDAMIMDGKTMNIGGVTSLRRIMNAISVASYVLRYTKQSILSGDQATEFAVKMGFQKQDIITEKSKNIFNMWKQNNCQPNFWNNVYPNPVEHCGPYEPILSGWPLNQQNLTAYKEQFGLGNQDSIGMIVIDQNDNIVAGTSTTGVNHKIPGSVDFSSIPGSGVYADNKFGAAIATGDSEIMMKFSPSMLALEYLRLNFEPTIAARLVIQRIYQYYPNFIGAIIVANRNGQYGAACNGIPSFPFSTYDQQSGFTVHAIGCYNS